MKPIFCGYLLLWAAASVAAQSSPPQDPAPLYVESSIVNAASPFVDGLAPNTIATVYGQFLSHSTRALSDDEVRAGVLPTTLRGTGVRVMVGGVLAPVIYVSPGQINFLVPSNLLPGNTELQVGIDSRYGPRVRVRLNDASPALFQMDPEFILATQNSDGSLVSNDRRAHADDLIVLYATGLGATTPKTSPGSIVDRLSQLTRLREFRIELNGIPLAPDRILYAGLAPGFAGLYQINLRLPEIAEPNPVIRIGFDGARSPDGLRLHAE
jgi:uncharacterized protein (TIGR03437 family)